MAGRVTIGRVLQSAVDSVRAVLRAGSKGATTEADVTSTVVDVDHQALDVALLAKRKSVVAVRTIVPASATDVVLIVANPARHGGLIFNDSDSPVRIGLGTAPTSSTDFSFAIPAHLEHELPEDFAGEVRAVWEVASGQACVTEMIV